MVTPVLSRTYDRLVTQTAPGAGTARPSAGRRPPRPSRAGSRRAARPRRVRYAALPPRRRDVAQDVGARVVPRRAEPAVAAALPVPAAPVVAGLAAGRRAVPAAGAAPGRVPCPRCIGCGLLRDRLRRAPASGTRRCRSRPRSPSRRSPTAAAALLRWCTVVATIGGVAWSQTLPGHNEPYDAIVQAFIFGAAWAVGTLSRRRRVALRGRGLARGARRGVPRRGGRPRRARPSGCGSPASCTTWWRTT